MALYSLPLAFH